MVLGAGNAEVLDTRVAGGGTTWLRAVAVLGAWLPMNASVPRHPHVNTRKPPATPRMIHKVRRDRRGGLLDSGHGVDAGSVKSELINTLSCAAHISRRNVVQTTANRSQHLTLAPAHRWQDPAIGQPYPPDGVAHRGKRPAAYCIWAYIMDATRLPVDAYSIRFEDLQR